MVFPGGDQVARIASLALVFLSTSISSRAQLGPVRPSAELGVIHCSVTASVPAVRIEGTRELVGDIVLSCHNALPSFGFEPTGFVQADISLSLNVDPANASDFGLGADVTDAVLVVNENHCPVSGANRSFGNCGTAQQTVQDPMLGRLDATRHRTVRWSNVAVPIPGAAIGSERAGASPVANCSGRFGVPGGCHPLTTTLRLTNIRVNASQLGASGAAHAPALAVQASLSIEPLDATMRIEDSLLRVGEAATGVEAALHPVDANRLCSHGETSAEITISEGFASAFKTTAKPTFRPGEPGWEEGYYPGAGSGENVGPALTGTRLDIALSGLPEGVRVSAPTIVSCSSAGSALSLVEGALADGSGGSAAAGSAFDRLVATGESDVVSVLYEVTSASPHEREDCRVPLRLTRSDRATGLVLGGEVTVAAGLAPVRTAGVGPNGFGLSRFVSSTQFVRPSFRLSPCGTTLFFPFVTNRTNFDTAVVIANTSSDPLGTRHQAGRCTLRYHRSGPGGQVQPAEQNSVELEAGKQLAFTLSSGNVFQGIEPVSDFQGYLVAECDFQHARGFAFVTEQINGTATLAQGYLAEIVRDPKESEVGSSPP